jgi:hypothetical protein
MRPAFCEAVAAAALVAIGSRDPDADRFTVKSRWAIDFEITPPAEEDREVYIDEPRQLAGKPPAIRKISRRRPRVFLQGDRAEREDPQGDADARAH